MRQELSIIVPVFNEEARIAQCVESLVRHAESAPYIGEIIIVVEKGDDDTVALGRQAAGAFPRIRFLELAEHRGKGFAVRSGVLASRCDLVAYCDVDLPATCAEFDRFYCRMASDPALDILAGNRRDPSSETHRSMVRRCSGALFAVWVRFLTGLDVSDPQCGFKMFRREAGIAVFNRLLVDGFAFDVEILMRARALKLRTESMPIRWIDGPVPGKTRVWRDGPRMLWDTYRLSRRADPSPVIHRDRERA